MTVAEPVPLPKIQELRVRPRHRLEVHWDDGSASVIDMTQMISDGTAFAPLRDPDFFATVRVGERRRTIEWPDPINRGNVLVDFCADSLREMAEQQKVGTYLSRILKELQTLRRMVFSHSPEKVS
jgi:hypothetical protein